ncbi:MAG: alpha/beta fold hydrolase [Pseudorhodoplanes sp.]|uniref:alpha/beta fold hydrolase n=1 Tax=Pseudorhodoplanes sp. TaxID=1934341 RepID=UPI003D14EF9F
MPDFEPQAADFTIANFAFQSGEQLPELRQHFLTLGEARRDADGRIVNAVLLLHNTTGSSSGWLSPDLAGELFGPGQPLDASKYFLVMPDAIGFGSSSKPSDGLRARFPRYRYQDMVVAQHRLLTERLGISHLRLVLGLSMGGMLTWSWGATFPDFMDLLVPLACQPSAMSGRNWIQRRMQIEAIRNDPDWNNGDYGEQPWRYTLTPFGALLIQSVVRIQEIAPTREAADALYRQMAERARKGDANDRLYQLESSMDYDPAPHLARITAPLVAINFADDELNPPELGIVEQAIGRMSNGRSVLVPATGTSRGHSTALQASHWKSHLSEAMKIAAIEAEPARP